MNHVPAHIERAWVLAAEDSSYPGYEDLCTVVHTATELAIEAGAIEDVTIEAVAASLD